MSTASDQGAAQPIRVLVNLTWLVPGVVGGSEESTTDALRAIAADMPGDLEIHLAVLKPFLSAHPDLIEAFPHHVLASGGRNKILRVFAEQTWLARTARSLEARVVHHAGGVVPLYHPGRIVLTIHDLQPLDLSENFSITKRTYLRLMLARSAKAAAVICVPSEFTARRVVALLGIARDRIRLVPWCISQPLVAHATPSAQPASTPAPDSAVDSAELAGVSAKSFNTQSKYFLYPAVTYPHKNHLMLLEAFAQVHKDDPEVSLVLTGASGPLEGEVLTRIQQLGLSDSVQRRGRVSQEQLDALFDRAVAVVVPSLYEGFGLPALEAMWRGCLVIGSDRGSLPEVLRAEDLVHAEDLTAWVTAMQSVLVLTTAQRDERVKAGQLRAAAFTPERTADALLNAYRSAGGILHEG